MFFVCAIFRNRQIKYGACYRLWNPSEHLSFGGNFRCAARSLFMCQRRLESPFAKLPDDCIYYILNMMRWDWVNDTGADMMRDKKNARRLRRRQMIADAEAELRESDARMAEEARRREMIADVEDALREPDARMAEDAESNVVPDDHVVLGVDEDEDDDDDDDDDDMEEDSASDSDDADTGSLDSAESDEYAWGDHVSSVNAFVYNDDDSLSDESDGGGGAGTGLATRRQGQQGMLRARRSILSFLRSGVH